MEEYYNDFQGTQNVQDQDEEQQFQYDFPTQVSKQMTQDIVAIVSTCFKDFFFLTTHNSNLLTSHSRSTKRMMDTTICSL